MIEDKGGTNAITDIACNGPQGNGDPEMREVGGDGEQCYPNPACS